MFPYATPAELEEFGVSLEIGLANAYLEAASLLIDEETGQWFNSRNIAKIVRCGLGNRVVHLPMFLREITSIKHNDVELSIDNIIIHNSYPSDIHDPYIELPYYTQYEFITITGEWGVVEAVTVGEGDEAVIEYRPPKAISLATKHIVKDMIGSSDGTTIPDEFKEKFFTSETTDKHSYSVDPSFFEQVKSSAISPFVMSSILKNYMAPILL